MICGTKGIISPWWNLWSKMKAGLTLLLLCVWVGLCSSLQVRASGSHTSGQRSRTKLIQDAEELQQCRRHTVAVALSLTLALQTNAAKAMLPLCSETSITSNCRTPYKFTNMNVRASPEAAILL